MTYKATLDELRSGHPVYVSAKDNSVPHLVAYARAVRNGGGQLTITESVELKWFEGLNISNAAPGQVTFEA